MVRGEEESELSKCSLLFLNIHKIKHKSLNICIINDPAWQENFLIVENAVML